MKKHDETTTSRYFRTPTGVTRFFALLLIVSLTGTAAGSCISYGHSCWGGRLEVPPAATLVDKHSGNRWQKEQKIFALPGNWDADYDTTRNDLVRDQSMDGNEIAETSVSMEDSKDLVDPIGLTQKIEKPDDETTKLLFVQARKAYDVHHPSRPRELRLYKILTDSSDDALK